LHHEAHHCRQRDPLRLLVSRLISDSFFFIPVLRNLTNHHHLAQEMAADAAAIEGMADVLPLASALHKLLTVSDRPWPATGLAISQLNITEYRIVALVAPDMPQCSRPSWLSWLFSSGVALMLMATIFVSGPAAQPAILTCDVDSSPALPLNLSNMSGVLVR
jgi:beta-lactamase regulating signal transducer with metallopeptidase domain